MEETPPAPWSDIPVDLAGLVLGRLPAHDDRVRFAAVCPQWRAAARQGKVPPPMPMLLLKDGTVFSLPSNQSFRFPDCAGYDDACGNWLLFRDEDGCFLRDPFSNATITLPALSRVRLQHLDDDDDDDVDMLGEEWMEKDEGEKLEASKIIFCSPHLIAAILRVNGDHTWIAVCQPGATSWWSVRMGQWAPLFLDFVFHQGKLYVLDRNDTLFAVDIIVDHSTGDPCVSQIQQVIGGLPTCPDIFLPDGVLIHRVNYLVESLGALLLVYREIDLRLKGNWDKIEVLEAERSRFEVYEANFGQSQWAKVTTIGDDQVLFLCRQFCRSVNISYNEMPGDHIFFMDNDGYSKVASSTCSVYDMRDGKMSNPLPMVSWKPGTVLATWFLP